MLKQLNLTIQPGRNYDPAPPMATFNRTPVDAMPFSKRKFSTITLSSQPVSYQRVPMQPVAPRPNAIHSYTRNLRHVPEPAPVVDNSTKMVWGKPTWYLLHMMAEKIRSDYFIMNRSEILQTIYTICINLPCPTCSGHAKEYLLKNQFFQIRTKDDLKTALFHFHNAVNARKNVKLFPAFELSQYETAVPKLIIDHFLVVFNRKSKNIRLIADDMHRQSVTAQLKSWFQRNIQYFDDAVSKMP